MGGYFGEAGRKANRQASKEPAGRPGVKAGRQPGEQAGRQPGRQAGRKAGSQDRQAQNAKKCDFSPTAFGVNNDKYEKDPSRTHAGTPGNEIATALRMQKKRPREKQRFFTRRLLARFRDCDTVVHFEGSDRVPNHGFSILPR